MKARNQRLPTCNHGCSLKMLHLHPCSQPHLHLGPECAVLYQKNLIPHFAHDSDLCPETPPQFDHQR
ncbi:hypothetical protein SASPL_143210 [Salvia splendens]|uniref:Uncharacterized protein n=1 Tax=Salvia splendens TaxID=180675 RepID=A0A8X8ZAL9_SALSN|nr:hypothetical protein SASPL_143210 [Salvia splendens]